MIAWYFAYLANPKRSKAHAYRVDVAHPWGPLGGNCDARQRGDAAPPDAPRCAHCLRAVAALAPKVDTSTIDAAWDSGYAGLEALRGQSPELDKVIDASIAEHDRKVRGIDV